MRNPLDKSSAAQILDGGRLMGSLHFPEAIFSRSAAHAQREPVNDDAHLNGSSNHEAVCALSEPTPFIASYRRYSQRPEANMKIAEVIVAGATLTFITCSSAIAQQSFTGTVSKVDEASGRIAIQQSQGGTVGANSGNASEEFKVQDGLMFNALQPGDKVVFTATEIGGARTITKLEKR
jgi:Cu/Ag efflux protein CusF